MMESIDIRHLPETSSEPVVAKKFKSVVFHALDCPYVELEILLTSDSKKLGQSTVVIHYWKLSQFV